MKTVVTQIQKRFGDVDVFNHVNNVRQQEYLDLGKTDYCRRMLELDGLTARPTLMIVSVKTDFVEQVRYRDDVFVRTWVESIGTKSLTMRQQIFVRVADGQETVCTECESVLVAFDRCAQHTIEIPQPWREIITGKNPVP